MCGIAGFYCAKKHYLKEPARYESILSSMASVQRHRGPDDEGIWLWEHAGFSHARLSIIDLAGGRQPMTKTAAGQTLSLIHISLWTGTDPAACPDILRRTQGIPDRHKPLHMAVAGAGAVPGPENRFRERCGFRSVCGRRKPFGHPDGLEGSGPQIRQSGK